MHLQQNLKSLFMVWTWSEQRCNHTAQKLAQLGPAWPLEVNNVLPCPGLRKVDLEESVSVYVCVCVGGGRVPWGKKQLLSFIWLWQGEVLTAVPLEILVVGLENSREPTFLNQLLPWNELSQLEGVPGGD